MKLGFLYTCMIVMTNWGYNTGVMCLSNVFYCLSFHMIRRARHLGKIHDGAIIRISTFGGTVLKMVQYNTRICP
jgi:hypothetical protein